MTQVEIFKPSPPKRQISSLRACLKELEPMVKERDAKGRLYLLNGSNAIKKIDAIPVMDDTVFNMRYREAWANWLLCAVFNYQYNADFTFQEMPENTIGDGIIFDKLTKKRLVVEHICAIDLDNGPKLARGTKRIHNAINKKFDKDKNNPGYANGKCLVVFTDGVGIWYPNKIGNEMNHNHKFIAVYCISMISFETNVLTYSVSEFKRGDSPTYSVTINEDFTNWEVRKLQ